MGLEEGAAKYLAWTFRYPVNYWIHGGVILWFLDWIDLFSSDSVDELAVNYVILHYGIPWPPEGAILQFLVGALAATLSWYLAMRVRQ